MGTSHVEPLQILFLIHEIDIVVFADHDSLANQCAAYHTHIMHTMHTITRHLLRMHAVVYQHVYTSISNSSVTGSKTIYTGMVFVVGFARHSRASTIQQHTFACLYCLQNQLHMHILAEGIVRAISDKYSRIVKYWCAIANDIVAGTSGNDDRHSYISSLVDSKFPNLVDRLPLQIRLTCIFYCYVA